MLTLPAICVSGFNTPVSGSFYLAMGRADFV